MKKKQEPTPDEKLIELTAKLIVDRLAIVEDVLSVCYRDLADIDEVFADAVVALGLLGKNVDLHGTAIFAGSGGEALVMARNSVDRAALWVADLRRKVGDRARLPTPKKSTTQHHRSKHGR
jgi:hypothetical protein